MFPQIITLGALVAVAHTACICREDTPQTPFWEAPCGNKIAASDYDDSKEIKFTDDIRRSMTMRSMREIKQNLKICQYFFVNQNFTATYKNLHSAYLNRLEWLPGRNSVAMDINSINDVPRAIENLYTNLQMFAIVFDQMSKEEKDEVKKKSIHRITIDLKSLLCDVQSNLIWLQVRVPTNAPAVPDNYKTTQNTDKTVRDYEAIKRYDEFIKQWLKFIRTTRKRFRKRRHGGNKKRTTLPS